MDKVLSGVQNLGVFSLYESGWCFVNQGGLTRMMSTPSGRVALKTSGDMDLLSMDTVEAQFYVASDGRSCGYVARRRVRR